MARRTKRESQEDETGVHGENGVDLSLSDTLYNELCKPESVENPTRAPRVKPDMVKGADLKLPSGREELIKAQKSDTGLINLYDKALSVEEADKVPVCYFVQDGVLVRKYRAPEIPASDEFKVLKQIMAPTKYRC